MRASIIAAVSAALIGVTAPAWAVSSSYRASSTQSPDALWAKVGDFCGISNWHPAVASCSLSADGKTRTLALKGGGEIVEHLVSRNNKKRSYTYTIVKSPFPVSDYRSTIHVAPATGGSALVWTGTYKAKGASDADAKKVIDGVYAGETLTK
ncbi:MAG: SRPBCC family protein [Acetobacteraceae bacterium]